MHYSLQNTLAQLPGAANAAYPKGLPFVSVLRHSVVEVELFCPATSGLGKDIQTPHTQDELYIVASGSAVLHQQSDGQAGPWQQHAARVGDALFVPAGAAHHFADFSADFAVWVVFFASDQVRDA